MISRIDGTGVFVGPPVLGGGAKRFFTGAGTHFRRSWLNLWKTKLVYLVCKDSVRTSERSHYVYIMIYGKLNKDTPLQAWTSP